MIKGSDGFFGGSFSPERGCGKYGHKDAPDYCETEEAFCALSQTRWRNRYQDSISPVFHAYVGPCWFGCGDVLRQCFFILLLQVDVSHCPRHTLLTHQL